MHTSNPDHICQETVAIEEHVPLACDTYRLRLPCPSIAANILPGQFLMLRLPGTNDPLLGRPLALYDTYRDASGRPQGVDIVYQAIGRMTRRLAAMKPGDRLEIWGPLGNGFPPTETGHLIMVAGGIGQTPFLALGPALPGIGRLRAAAAGRPASPESNALLWPSLGCISGGGRRLSPLGRRGLDQYRRRLGRAPRHGDRTGAAGGRSIALSLPDRRLWAGEDVARHGRHGCRIGTSLPGFPGKPHGLRDRNLLQLRDEDPRSAGRVGLSPDLRRGADFQRRRRGILVWSASCRRFTPGNLGVSSANGATSAPSGHCCGGLQCLDPGGQPRLGPRGGIAMNDLVGGSTIELLGGNPQAPWASSALPASTASTTLRTRVFSSRFTARFRSRRSKL